MDMPQNGRNMGCGRAPKGRFWALSDGPARRETLVFSEDFAIRPRAGAGDY
jgi:hypothetical protein